MSGPGKGNPGLETVKWRRGSPRGNPRRLPLPSVGMPLSHGDRVMKVNHAGEHGAVNIYRGQRLVCFWRDAELKRDLEEFRAHEERHRAIFAAESSPR